MASMKRDWDLLRKQLTDIEEERDVLADIPDEPKWLDGQPWEDYEAQLNEYNATVARIAGHLEMLIDTGYVEGVQVLRGCGGDFSFGLASPRLTMAGHDLLDTIRSATIWESIKTTAKKKGIELTFEAVKALGGYALKQLIQSP
jgi:hypothetical protein